MTITEWLTADEAAAYLRFSTRKALYQAVRRGLIQSHRLGRRLRFLRSDLDTAAVRTASATAGQGSKRSL